MYFSHGTSNQRGVAIAIAKDYDVTIHNVVTDNEGRFIVMFIERNNVKYSIGNIYAPTRNFERDQQVIFQNFMEVLQDNLMEHVIFGGDFNIYLNPRLDKLDTMPDSHDNANYRKDIMSTLEPYNLVDVWRTLNPDQRIFTWHRANKRSRLVYLFMSEHLLNIVHQVDIAPGIHSDHSLLSLSLSTDKTQPRGRVFWKFNASLLRDTNYVAETKQVILSAKAKYEYIMDKGLAWDLVKLDIRDSTMRYSGKKKREGAKYEKDLNERYHKLYTEVNVGHNVSEESLQEFYNVKAELETIENHRAKGIILRSKTQWTEEGEKNTAYFLRLEKNNYCNKHITQLQVNNDIIKDPGDILNEECRFYEALYSDENLSNNQCNDEHLFLRGAGIPQLDEEQKSKCENSLSEKDLLTAVKSMKNGKSPGSDGLTSEFSKFFWSDIKDNCCKA